MMIKPEKRKHVGKCVIQLKQNKDPFFLIYRLKYI